jgi:hypothetical protein
MLVKFCSSLSPEDNAYHLCLIIFVVLIYSLVGFYITEPVQIVGLESNIELAIKAATSH